MSGSRNGRVLRIAVAGSLAVHLFVATLVHPRQVQAKAQQTPTPTTIIHLIPPPVPKPTPPPPPKPAQPQPRHTERRASAHRPAMHLVHTTTRNNVSPPGVAIATEPPGPPDTGTAPPVIGGPTDGPAIPSPTPKPACSAPDVAARTVTVQSPNTPDDMQGTSATAKIRVDLDADGDVLGVSVYESAGSMELDRAALQAARASRYAPEEKDCKKIPGSYLFTVDFATM